MAKLCQCLIIVFLIVGCTSDPEPTPIPIEDVFNYQVRVIDASTQIPIVGATVALIFKDGDAPYTEVTDNNGIVFLQVNNRYSGKSVAISIIVDGYVVRSERITVMPRAPTQSMALTLATPTPTKSVFDPPSLSSNIVLVTNSPFPSATSTATLLPTSTPTLIPLPDFDTALFLDGSKGQYARVEDNNFMDFNQNEHFTIEVRVLVDPIQGFAGSQVNAIVEKWTGQDGYPYVIRYANRNNRYYGRVVVARYDGEENPSIISDTIINDGRFHHIAFVKRGGELFLYVDGNLEGCRSNANRDECVKDTTVNTTENESSIYFGRRGSTGNYRSYFTGAIDEVRIWNIARTQDQIRSNMQQPISANQVGLVGYWQFDTRHGNQVTNNSFSEIHGVLYGGASLCIVENVFACLVSQ